MTTHRARRILVPTDGSPRARRAARFAAGLARRTGARMVGVFVAVEGVPTLFDRTLYQSPALSPVLQRTLRRRADRALAAVEREAARQRVPCDSVHAHGRHAWKAILGTAQRRHCQLVVMPAGGETARLLAHSRIPVVVCR